MAGWAGLAPSQPLILGWCLDAVAEAVMGFFSYRSAKASKKGNISSAAQSCAHGQT